MTEPEIRKSVAEFFTKHDAGRALLERWERRVEQMKRQLVTEGDIEIIRTLQGSIQMYEKVVLPEVMDGRPRE